MKGITFSNAVLKNIAYATMLIDHFFAVVFLKIVRQYAAAGYETGRMRQVYSAGRAVGRIAFVLFAYLAVEGFVHTRSRRNYLLRLGAFAFVSEVPFDLAFSGQIIDRNSQNVFFTLFLGVFALVVWEWGRKRVRRLRRRRGGRGLYRNACIAALAAVRAGGVLLCCWAALSLQTDYKFMGVLLIFSFYLTREQALPVQMVLAGFVLLFGTWSINCLRYLGEGVYSAENLFLFSMRELYGMAAFAPIALYGGRLGRQLPKVVCYGFYPAHLLALYAIARIVVGE